MTTNDFAFVLRKLGLAAALICVLLSLTVFAVLLIVEHEPVWQAAAHALPLMVYALFGLFGAAMTRLIGRRTH
ncbi:hypothetical protein JQ582_26825 [Bradyrhizobium japonicum]|uniref:hypothetical protein n=1 Tax=Bradyrhizobium japonicum TaxID=375 RepID=UPI001BA82BFA|nr:hypothetical protein [Bradyrhizobium japonicum]MBR0747554.1 hypothetical protein [Bradyrhizobium japonicum]MCS3500285.1 hypothetical protein [Bradyrhizobium japonicum]MCS3957560.1 hypothetical protein [Bradyrhizobium japonicum]MCS3999309.1 hypothetical protein [Bradyrhizobium japonicum]